MEPPGSAGNHSLDSDRRLIEHEQRLRLAEQAAAVGIWEIDIASDTVRGSHQFFRNMGLEPTEDPVLMDVLRGLRPSDHRERVNRGYAEAVDAGRDFYESEYRIIRPDGKERWILGRGKVIRNSDGLPVRYSGVDIDVTDRKRAEIAMQESEARLRLALRATPIGIWDWNLDSNKMIYSPRAREICGFSADQALTLEDIRSVTHPDDLPNTLAQAQRALDPDVRDQQPFEYRLIRADNQQMCWVVAHGEAIFERIEDQVKAVRYIGTIEDITRRKLAENALREAELRQRLAIDASRVAVWEIDLSTDHLTVSPELNRMFGLPPDAMPSAQELRAMFVSEDLDRVTKERENAISSGGHLESEFRCRFPDGSTRWRLIRGEVVSGNDDASPRRLLGLVIDIDDMKRAEERQAILLREVHHRVKNSLSVVQALATQTFSGRADLEALEAFRGRLSALSTATQLAISTQGQPFLLQDLIQTLASPYFAEDRVSIRGDEVMLPARLNVALALTLNELFTNAAKFGSLSVAQGKVSIEWSLTESSVELGWIERGGPKVPAQLDRNFGLNLILNVLPVEIGEVAVFPNSDGLECRLSIRRSHK